MNTKIKLSALVVLVTLFGLFAPAAPASAMTCNSATITGTVITGTPPAHARFEYGTDFATVSNGGGITTQVQIFNTEGTFPIQQFISGLAESTTYFYRLAVTNNFGTINTSINNFTTPACTVTPPTGPTATLSANPTSIQSGQSSVLSWSSTNALTCMSSWFTGDPTGRIPLSGTSTVSPTTTTNYSITCTGASGTTPATARATVTVNQLLPTVTLSANPSSVQSGQSSIITWFSNNAMTCNASGGTNGWAGAKTTSGSFNTGALSGTTTFNITCTGNTGAQASDSTTVSVTQASTCQNPSAINFGGPLPCQFPPTTCQNPSAINFGGPLPCQFPPTTCQNPSAINFGGPLPCQFPPTTCQNPSAINFGGPLPCQFPPTTCQNPSAINFGGPLPCQFPPTTCQNPSAINFGGPLPCQFPPTTCQNPNAINLGGLLPCQFPPTTCQNPSAINFGGQLPCQFPPTTCQNPSAINFGGQLPCQFPPTTCQNPSAINLGGLLPCQFPPTTCQNPTAINFGGQLPCQFQQNNNQVSVSISADRTSLAFNESTVIRWFPNNATSCFGSGGSNGWSGSKNTFSDSFNTSPLAFTTTYTISCSGFNGSTDSRSVTVFVGNQQPPISNSLTAITNSATQITRTSAQLNSLILSSGNNSTNAWFEWGTTTGLGNETTRVSIGSLPSANHADTLTGLTGGVTYYFRAVAENSTQRSVGSILNFTTNAQTIIINPRPTVNPTSLVLINSTVDRNQPIVPTVDNSRPHPGDEINYTVNYQNIGTGSITNLNLQINLPAEVDYLFSNPSNPNISGNTLVFRLGTLRANGSGVVTVRVRVRDNIPEGTNLNFPATLSYIDPSGFPQTVSANVTAQVFSQPANANTVNLGANVFGAGFLPTNLFGWLLLLVLILILVFLAKHLFNPEQPLPFSKKTTTTTIKQ